MDHALPQRAPRPGDPPLARLEGLPDVSAPTLDRGASAPPPPWLGEPAEAPEPEARP